MMRILSGLQFFYMQLLLPALGFAGILSFTLTARPHFFKGLGIAFMILLPAIHYFMYDLRKPQEYYFYYNLGLSKTTLWVTTMSFSTIFGIMIALI